MKKSTIFLLLFFCMSILSLHAGSKTGWKSLFDGKTLKGWSVKSGTATYRVENGTIIGKTTDGSPNTFLCSEKSYGDFELEFEVWIAGGNSGVQIRSKAKTEADVAKEMKKSDSKKNEPQKGTKKKKKNKSNKKNKHSKVGRVYGPQVEIEASPGQSGWIYGEGTGLKWLSEAPKSKDPDEKQNDFIKNSDWNKYRVVAKGQRIQTWINNKKVADLTHEEIYKTHPSGFIGLQIHGIKKGSPAIEVKWRNIKIKEL